MFKFSKQFFILFILVTVLPVFLMLCWNLYSIKKIDDKHIKLISEMQEEITRSNFEHYLKNEIAKKKQIINNLKNYKFSLKEYQYILNTSDIWWLDDTKEIKSIIPSFINNNDNVKGSYEVIFNNKTRKQELITYLILPLKNNPHKGLVIIKKVPVEELTPQRPPTIVRITAGKDIDTSKIIYFSFKPKNIEPFKHDGFRKMRPPHPSEDTSPFKDRGFNKFGPPKPPKETDKLDGLTIPIKNYENETIANIEIGVPGFIKPFGFLHNPMFSMIFENIYLIGLTIPLLGLILSFIAGYYLKRNFLNPIENLSKVSEQFSDGNLKVRVCSNVKQQDIKKTILNFNNMLDSIQEKEELKENFITNLTHDFRTPLIAENRTLEILLSENEKPNAKEKKDLLKSLLKNNVHLLDMVNVLLNTYKFESGMLTLEKKPVSLKPLIEQCFEQLKTLQEEKDIIFNLDCPPDIPEIKADYGLIKRCFLNLITNAIENIPKKSTINVSCWEVDDNIKISIEDNGPGIPEEVVKQLFDRYYAGRRTERKIGSGLGLYICKQLIEAHGGTIEVDSVPGEYSDFIITIPLK